MKIYALATRGERERESGRETDRDRHTRGYGVRKRQKDRLSDRQKDVKSGAGKLKEFPKRLFPLFI